jgi:hypothetical protein
MHIVEIQYKIQNLVDISTAFRKMYNVYKEYASETDLKKIHEILQ